MALLLTRQQQNSIKLLDNNWCSINKVTGVARTNYEELAENVEESDLALFLGFPLLQDLQENPTEANNIILLDGGSFTNCDNQTVKFKGVRYLLAFLNHYRYVSEISTTDTASGYVQAKTGNSEIASAGAKGEIKAFSKQLADNEMSKLRTFLNENCETYPLWASTKSRKPHSYKITPVKRY